MVGPDLKVIAVALDSSEQHKSAKVLCLSVVAEGISILLSFAGKLVGVTPQWKRILDVLALMPFIPETVVRGWSLSGGRSGLAIAACTLKCLSSFFPLLGVLVFRCMVWEESWALLDHAMRNTTLSALDHNYLAYKICEDLLTGMDEFAGQNVADEKVICLISALSLAFVSPFSINARRSSSLITFSSATFCPANPSILVSRSSHILYAK
jgi:hypothetical protein